MFWGCFSYDKKGSCHIWKTETKKEKKEKKEAQADVDFINATNEAHFEQSGSSTQQ